MDYGVNNELTRI